jgi:phosphoribosylformylglycinamidine cyclo-ligase
MVERKRLVDGKQIQPGDVAIGLASTGFHSNGYSLVRKAVFDYGKLQFDDTVEELGGVSVAEALLRPTRLYARPVRGVLRRYRVKQPIHGIAHITGGGLEENLARIVPDKIQVVIERGSWRVPPVFPWVQRLGSIEDAEMARVFNMGVGMVLVVSPHFADSVISQLGDADVEAWRIGEVRAAAASEARVVMQ